MQKKPVSTLIASLAVALPLLVSGAAPASAAPALVVDAPAVLIEVDPPVLAPAFSKWWCEAFNC